MSPRASTRARGKGGARSTTASSRSAQAGRSTELRGGRISKPSTRPRGRSNQLRTQPARSQPTFPLSQLQSAREARDAASTTSPSALYPSTVSRTDTSLHGCSDLSLAFVTACGLRTSPDTNVITLNLMDYFLFSESNWLPELSYCRLHAACFFMASAVTGLDHTAEQVAESLGPEAAFVREMAALLAVDDEGDVAIRQLISVDQVDVEDGHKLLHERRNDLASLMGGHAARIDGLPVPRQRQIMAEQATSDVPYDGLDVFEES